MGAHFETAVIGEVSSEELLTFPNFIEPQYTLHSSHDTSFTAALAADCP
jgi:hypothetical protein